MIYEEFEEMCNRLDAELAAEQARQNKFIDALENELVNISIQHYPETEPFKHLFIEDITEKAHMRAVYINELLDMLVAGVTHDEEADPDSFTIPNRDVSDEEQRYLDDILKTIPPQGRSDFIKDNAERVAYEAQEREFLFLCHDKVKELIGLHFPEMINFSGNSIRRINWSTYYDMSEWINEFYFYAGEYINEEYLNSEEP